MPFDRSAPRMNALSLAFGLACAAALAGCGKNDTTAASTPAPAPASTSAATPAAPPATGAASSAGVGSGSPTGPSIAATASSSEAANVVAARAAPPVQPTAGTSATPAGSAEMGQKVFGSACVVCHGAGVAGAPKLGDKADWTPRIAQGTEVLYQHALAGYTGKKGVMPPKGGNTSLADADVRSAVDYMVSQAR